MKYCGQNARASQNHVANSAKMNTKNASEPCLKTLKHASKNTMSAMQKLSDA
jgi:hypothetical protein